MNYLSKTEKGNILIIITIVLAVLFAVLVVVYFVVEPQEPSSDPAVLTPTPTMEPTPTPIGERDKGSSSTLFVEEE